MKIAPVLTAAGAVLALAVGLGVASTDRSEPAGNSAAQSSAGPAQIGSRDSSVEPVPPFKFAAYVNNQTLGTRARFYNINIQRTSFTMPAPYVGTTSLSPRKATYIRPC